LHRCHHPSRAANSPRGQMIGKLWLQTNALHPARRRTSTKKPRGRPRSGSDPGSGIAKGSLGVSGKSPPLVGGSRRDERADP
jgi:hypothetical protein